MKNKNCYDCKFKGSVPGSAHSSCNILKEAITDSSKRTQLELLLATHQVKLTMGENEEPMVKMNEHGIKNGWANWPLDFDPVWIEDCKFFNEKNLEVQK